ncbi:uncharacterized protein LOC132447283 [Gadus macrocephalus]|uniref:uncharacterized protein LOC132447283 n=1 Tax=Gadus macrocephalus TaxID=80720 RepID=UPI0028CB59FB|nr:uncharacterized protein LOC132447283 [Gadus macrocephalus]
MEPPQESARYTSAPTWGGEPELSSRTLTDVAGSSSTLAVGVEGSTPADTETQTMSSSTSTVSQTSSVTGTESPGPLQPPTVGGPSSSLPPIPSEENNPTISTRPGQSTRPEPITRQESELVDPLVKLVTKPFLVASGELPSPQAEETKLPPGRSESSTRPVPQETNLNAVPSLLETKLSESRLEEKEVLTVPLTHGGEGSDTGATHSSSGRSEEQDAAQEEEGREKKKGTHRSGAAC